MVYICIYNLSRVTIKNRIHSHSFVNGRIWKMDVEYMAVSKKSIKIRTNISRYDLDTFFFSFLLIFAQ